MTLPIKTKGEHMAHNFFKKALQLAGVLTALHLINEYVSSRAVGDYNLEDAKGKYYNWKGLNIFYKTIGEGKPLLLVHETSPESSLLEWRALAKKLAATNKVYMIDLPGCGNSARPRIVYTNYYYTQLLQSFIKEIIKEQATLITSRNSSIAGIIAASLDKETIKELILISPSKVSSCRKPCEKAAILKGHLLRTHIIGKFVYNLLLNKTNIDKQFKNAFYDSTKKDCEQYITDCYRTSHISASNGNHLLASILECDLIFDFSYCLSKTECPVYIVEGEALSDAKARIDEYKALNSDIKAIIISKAKSYPHIECPEDVANIIRTVTESQDNLEPTQQ